MGTGLEEQYKKKNQKENNVHGVTLFADVALIGLSAVQFKRQQLILPL